MGGRKFNWIRKRLGLSKVELTGSSGVGGNPWVMVSGSHGVIQEPSEMEEEMMRKPNGRQGNRVGKG